MSRHILGFIFVSPLSAHSTDTADMESYRLLERRPQSGKVVSLSKLNIIAIIVLIILLLWSVLSTTFLAINVTSDKAAKLRECQNELQQALDDWSKETQHLQEQISQCREALDKAMENLRKSLEQLKECQAEKTQLKKENEELKEEINKLLNDGTRLTPLKKVLIISCIFLVGIML